MDQVLGRAFGYRLRFASTVILELFSLQLFEQLANVLGRLRIR